ncbi:MAG: hypothetical protein JO316_23720 [Abitibacteriaceae bacterium]|nr:hypothetical protein [Abditibacteriaceae bacterium]
MPEQELITPAQSDHLVMIAMIVVTIIGAIWGYRTVGGRGALAGLCGPLVFVMWQFHKYVTRFDPGFDPVTHKYDPSREYYGLDKVKVLLFEVVLFVVLGAVLGWVWTLLSRDRLTQDTTQKAQSLHEAHKEPI